MLKLGDICSGLFLFLVIRLCSFLESNLSFLSTVGHESKALTAVPSNVAMVTGRKAGELGMVITLELNCGQHTVVPHTCRSITREYLPKPCYKCRYIMCCVTQVQERRFHKLN